MKRENNSKSITVSMRCLRATSKNLTVSLISPPKLEESIVKMFSGLTVFNRVRLARLLLKIRKNNSAPRACAFLMAGSTKIALPISDNSMKSSLRGVSGPRLKIFLTPSIRATIGLATAQSGTPTQWSMARMVLTLILIVDSKRIISVLIKSKRRVVLIKQ